MRSTHAVINLKYLKENYLNIRRKVNNVKVMPVVKANAYGHGVDKIVKALNSLEEKPEYYAVALVCEALELRKLNVPQPILLFEPVSENNVKEILEFNFIPTVFSIDHLELLKNNTKDKIRIQVNIDTGMRRLGIDYSNAVEFIKTIDNDKSFIIDGIYSHFATSDEKNKDYATLQLNRFKEIIYHLKKENIVYGLAHIANSGAILDIPESYLDMVRPGISLYGYYPSNETSESIQLKPVMSLVSKVDTLNRIEEGESISYGRKFFTDSNSNIISVSIGYADGYSRSLTNKSKAIIKGKFYNQVGTVTMDRIMFDVKNDPVSIGDEVLLLGENNNLSFTAKDWAEILNTIPYEITCGINSRVPRLYIN